MNLRDLRYLVALADERHFGKAAERCFVSQPTLSAQIKKLEEYLGVTLVERQPKRVALTEAGRRSSSGRGACCRKRTRSSSREARRATRSPASCAGADPDHRAVPAAGVAPRIRKALPRLELMLYEYQTGPMLEKLHAGEIDVGILALPVTPDGLESRRCTTSRSRRRAGQRTRSRRTAQRAARRPRGETLLLLEDGHCLRDQALDVCSRIDVHEKQDFRATSLETLRQMVAAGHGVTLLPELAAATPSAPRAACASSRSRSRHRGRTIGAVWRKSSTRGKAIDALIAAVRAAMKQESKR
jgi:LysR family transcriptional regulator, hydrogen peroxide-inducible genes activator